VPGRDKLLATFRSLVFNRFAPSDRDEVCRFRCAEKDDDPGRATEKAIQWMPDDIGNYGPRAEFVLARRDGELVGVVVCGPADDDSVAVTVYALGVKEECHRQAIGSVLKLFVMGLAATRDDWPNVVGSQVHQENFRMNAVNDLLGVARQQDPDDVEYFQTAVIVDIDDPAEQPDA
jgi:ribosomal protein S18 acetylase RimI-like enzyme